MRFRKFSWLLAPLALGACAEGQIGESRSSEPDASPVDVGFMGFDLGFFPDAEPPPSDSGLPDALAAADSGFPDARPPIDTGVDAGPECVYPDFVSPMALGSAIAPWSWPRAIDAAGIVRDLSMRDVFCDTDDVDWSPFDMLLFIGIPAW